MEGPLFFATKAHLLLCTGPRCSRRGSTKVFEEGWRIIEERRLAYYRTGGTVRLTMSGCLGACDHGPTLACYYGDEQGRLSEAWYAHTDVAKLVAVAEALDAGEDPPPAERFDRR